MFLKIWFILTLVNGIKWENIWNVLLCTLLWACQYLICQPGVLSPVGVGPDGGPEKRSEGWNTSPVRKVWDSGAGQPGEEKPLGRSCRSLPVPQGAYKKGGDGLSTRFWSDTTRRNGFKLKEVTFRLDIRKKFFTLRVVKPWHRLPWEAVAAPSLEVLKVRLDGALSNLV